MSAPQLAIGGLALAFIALVWARWCMLRERRWREELRLYVESYERLSRENLSFRDLLLAAGRIEGAQLFCMRCGGAIRVLGDAPPARIREFHPAGTKEIDNGNTDEGAATPKLSDPGAIPG